jgi:hypothetical protein
MPFSVSWHTLLEHLEDLPADATLVTPLSRNPFRITDVQEHRVLVEYREESGTVPLQREQFETLYERIHDAPDGFDLNRLPPDAEPYATVLSIHPRFEVDDREGTITELASPTSTAPSLVDATLDIDADDEDASREEPEIPVYADALLLIDTLERHDPTDLAGMETPALVNLYTLLSDVQRNANDLRQVVSEVLLDRLHHDRSVSGQYGSIQRTTRRNRSLKPDEEVLAIMEDAGIAPEQILGVDRDKVDDALEVTDLAESDVYDVEEREYVRKAEVDEDVKESRLQGLKDRLATADGEDTETLQQEIEELEARIEELTSFQSGRSFHTPASSDSS